MPCHMCIAELHNALSRIFIAPPKRIEHQLSAASQSGRCLRIYQRVIARAPQGSLDILIGRRTAACLIGEIGDPGVFPKRWGAGKFMLVH